MINIFVSWGKETIEYDKSLKRNDGIYPDTVLWGISINGLLNPTLKSFLDEIANAINQLEKEK
jgi:hypothetical protein